MADEVVGPGGACDLDAIDLLPADDSTGRLTAVELRFILDPKPYPSHLYDGKPKGNTLASVLRVFEHPWPYAFNERFIQS